jgi:hypothetical protein
MRAILYRLAYGFAAFTRLRYGLAVFSRLFYGRADFGRVPIVRPSNIRTLPSGRIRTLPATNDARTLT